MVRQTTGTKFHELSKDEMEALEKVIRIIQAFRDVEPRMPTSYADAFLQVARRPGEGPTEYAKHLHTTQPAASRLLIEIGSTEQARERNTGLGLVDRQISAQSLRNQEYFLTARGRQLLGRLLDVIKG